MYAIALPCVTTTLCETHRHTQEKKESTRVSLYSRTQSWK
jgi:hypothetical protein